MASCEKLLQSIQPGTKMTKDLFKQIYGFAFACPGFADEVIVALEAAGNIHARQYYEVWLAGYEASREAGIKEAAAWYTAECEKKWKILQEGSEERRRQEMYSADIAQSSCLPRQRKKLAELKQRLRALN